MKLPEIGELNRRVSLFRVNHEPIGDSALKGNREMIAELWAKREVIGGQNYWQSVNLSETVTHRFYVRWISGETRPIDLERITEIECEGIRYRVRRITDVNDAHRFTMLECEEVDYAD